MGAAGGTASAPLVHRLRPGVGFESDGVRTVALVTPLGSARFADLTLGQLAALGALARGGATEGALLGMCGDEPGGAAWLYYTLTQLAQLGLIESCLGDSASALAVIRALGRGYAPTQRLLLPHERVRLSRFAYLRQRAGEPLLESPRSHVEIAFSDWRGPAVVASLTSDTSLDVWDPPPGVDRQLSLALVQTLFQHGFLEPSEVSAQVEADPGYQALSGWEFHDLLFHARSRSGRHRAPYGATYRFASRWEPLPAVKEVDWPLAVSLPRPDMATLRRTDPPFAEVMERRRSLRAAGPQPFGLTTLGEFLYRSARVRGRLRTEHEEVSNRPYPGGGADYELEIYPLVSRLDGLERGLYYYAPLTHTLHRVAAWSPQVEAWARDAARKAPPAEIADVTLAITARFHRLTYKYQSIAYAVALKDLGVLYQTFYLVAAAMHLAASAVGGGDSDLFASISGLAYHVEPQIGEFLLNSIDPAEAATRGSPFDGL